MRGDAQHLILVSSTYPFLFPSPSPWISPPCSLSLPFSPSLSTGVYVCELCQGWQRTSRRIESQPPHHQILGQILLPATLGLRTSLRASPPLCALPPSVSTSSNAHPESAGLKPPLSLPTSCPSACGPGAGWLLSGSGLTGFSLLPAPAPGVFGSPLPATTPFPRWLGRPASPGPRGDGMSNFICI